MARLSARLQKKARKRRPKSNLEVKVEAFLTEEGIVFQSQYAISRIHTDIYFPGTNTVLEINGCFWHGHSVCQPKPYSKTQARRRIKDAARSRFVLKAGYNLLIIWGCEIEKNWPMCAKKLREAGRRR